MRFKKRQKIKVDESRIIINHFRLEGVNIDIEQSEESITKSIIQKEKSPNKNKSKSVKAVVKMMKRKFEGEVKKLPAEANSKYNEDTKTDHFYQRNLKPIMALKDVMISFILVVSYYQPIVQTFGVTLTLGLFLALDFYYQPNKEKKDNLGMLFNSTVFFLISVSLTSLSVIEDLLSREMIYYIIGYGSIFLILALIIRNIVISLKGTIKG